MEVVADLGERVLGGFSLEIPQLVDTTALYRRSRPNLPDGASQSGVPVNDCEYRRPQPARDKIVEAALPRRERLACAQLPRKELVAAVGEDADHAQHRGADDFPGTTHAQSEAIEVYVDYVEVGERARPPGRVSTWR
jgi:hypothetical protein